MSRFAADERKPTGSLVVGPTAFADDYKERPGDDSCIGLRLLSEQDIVFARGEAAKLAVSIEEPEARLETYNDALMRYLVARAACDPNNATEPFFPDEDIAFRALSVEGTKALYDAYERLTIETSPVQPEATAEDLLGVAELAVKALPMLPPERASRVRRLLGFCILEMTGALDA